MNQRIWIPALSAMLLCLGIEAHAASSKFTVKFKLVGGINTVNCLSKTGVLYPGAVLNGKATVTIPSSSVADASCFALNSDGRLLGPVFAPKGTKGLLAFVSKPADQNKKPIKSVTLTLRAPAAGENFAMLTKLPKGRVFNAKYQYTPSSTPALGLLLSSAASAVKSRAGTLRTDQDGDGVVDSIDADIDGDGISNLADSSATGTNSIGTLENDEVALPFTALYLSMPETLNWRINRALSDSEIDVVIGGENKFNIAFFFNLSADQFPTITWGHVICDSPLAYCRPTSAGASTGVYSGFNEGNSSLIGRLWSSINTDGFEYSLERLTLSGGGGSSEITLAASIQPRVGANQFRPGDAYRVDFTSSSGSIVTSRPLILPPYFVSVPAIKNYNITSSDSAADVAVDYSGDSNPGMNLGNPIVLPTSGEFEGKLRLSIYRLQRLAISPSESGTFRDYGHLNYGVIINNNAGEFSCGNLYSNLSSTLTEVTSVGTGGSYQSQNGANLWPLVDSVDDFDPESIAAADVANESISFTIDLKNCLARNGLTAGVHQVSLIAAGIDTGHGANRAGQLFYAQIP